MMRSVEKSPPGLPVNSFRRALLRWFKGHGRDLPWRRTSDPYAIMVSEFMLQQTQVATVLPYYERWLERFPDFAILAQAEESEVLHAWQGLGYYSRARHLQAAARMVQQSFEGKLPANPATIAQLPGVGRYTAGAIASFGFDLPEPIVDANIARVLARLTNWWQPIDSTAGQKHLWTAAAALVPSRGTRTFNSALMDLGATVCLPRRPRCLECPVRPFCQATDPAGLPVKRKKPATVHRTECHSFTRRRDRLLLEQSNERWRGMWILPRLPSQPGQPAILRLDFPFTHHRITLAVYPGGSAATSERHRWFPVRALADLPVPSPHRRALAQLLPND